MGGFQSYHLMYEATSYCLKVIITQLGKPDAQQQMISFNLFMEVMDYLESSIHSVMKLYIPSAELPKLYLACPLCDVAATPHIPLECTKKISPSMPPLCCANKGVPEVLLLRSSYLPYGDSLTKENFSKSVWVIRMYSMSLYIISSSPPLL